MLKNKFSPEIDDIKIDFVIPWVDGNDPKWIDQKKEYIPNKNEDDRIIRFRDWDNLQYWFRGVEYYAPWVNKIHFITCGHLPKWLNTNHPKLNIVKHENYIPSEYLPTFSSHVIELNMHRIEGLAEHFVYFNDDIFITRPLKKTHFFKNGLPCDCCISNAITPRLGEFSPILLQTVSIINKHFNKSDSIRKNFTKWFNIKYGNLLLRTVCLIPWHFFTGFYNHHLAIPYLKQTLEKVWMEEEEILKDTCGHKFRNNEDVNQYIFRYWQLVQGEFSPTKPLGKSINITENSKKLLTMIRNQTQYLLCLNDSDFEGDFNLQKKNILESMQMILPQKSSYEL